MVQPGFFDLQIYVDVGPVGLLTIEVTSADESREIIKLRDPLMLPAPR